MHNSDGPDQTGPESNGQTPTHGLQNPNPNPQIPTERKKKMAMATVSLLRFSPLPSLHPLPKSHLYVNPTVKIPPFPQSKAPRQSMSSAMPATDRLLSSLSYTLPFLNSLSYGRFLFARFPPLALALQPILPLVAAYRAVPLAGFVAFFALYLGVVRNPAFSRFVRFNAMQAVVLDVLLAVPSLLQRVFGVPVRGIGFKVMEFGFDAIFVFAAACFVYSFVSCILGKTPYLPVAAIAADRQL